MNKSQFNKLVLFLTKRCNLRCPACQWILQDENFFQNSDLSLHEARDLVDFYYEKGCRVIMPQAEGEVLLYKEYMDLVEYAVALGYRKPSLVTNGILIDRYADAILKNISSVLISVDGYDAETFEYRRGGSEKIFNKILSNIKLLRDKRAVCKSSTSVSLSCVIGKFNLDYIPKMIRFAETLEVDKLILRSFHPVGETDLQPLNENDIQVSQSLLEICERTDYSIDIVMPSLISASARPRCSMLFDTVLVGADGSFSPCCHIATDEKFGNAFVDPMAYSKGLAQQLRNQFEKAVTVSDLPSGCQSCPRLDPRTPVFDSQRKQWEQVNLYLDE